MKKSNIATGLVAFTMVAVTGICLFGFREREDWRLKNRPAERQAAEVQQEKEQLMAFAARCTGVEELVVESDGKYRSRILVTDTAANMRTGIGMQRMKTDTIFENGGKKLIFRIRQLNEFEVPYYELHLLLPALKQLQVTNANLDCALRRPGSLQAVLSGEAAVSFNNGAYPAGLNVSLGGTCLAAFPKLEQAAGLQITAAGNALVMLKEKLAAELKAAGRLVLKDNAVTE